MNTTPAASNEINIEILSPGKAWFNREAIKVNGRIYSDHGFKTFKVPDLWQLPEFEPPPSMPRFELQKWYVNKSRDILFMNNTLLLCEYYGISETDLETIVEYKTGYKKGWLQEYWKSISDPDQFITDDALRVITIVLDEIAGLASGNCFNLFAAATLYYNFGLVYSLAEVNYLVPANNHFTMSRLASPVKAVELKLRARGKYTHQQTTRRKTEILYKRWFVESDQR